MYLKKTAPGAGGCELLLLRVAIRSIFKEKALQGQEISLARPFSLSEIFGTGRSKGRQAFTPLNAVSLLPHFPKALSGWMNGQSCLC